MLNKDNMKLIFIEAEFKLSNTTTVSPRWLATATTSGCFDHPCTSYFRSRLFCNAPRRLLFGAARALHPRINRRRGRTDTPRRHKSRHSGGIPARPRPAPFALYLHRDESQLKETEVNDDPRPKAARLICTTAFFVYVSSYREETRKNNSSDMLCPPGVRQPPAEKSQVRSYLFGPDGGGCGGDECTDPRLDVPSLESLSCGPPLQGLQGDV